MLFYTVSVFSVATFGLFSAGKATLPFTPCKRNSVDFADCLQRSIEEAWPRFSAGLPEYDFPPLDPMYLEHLPITVDLDNVRGEIIISNLTALGISTIRFPAVRSHFHDNVFRLEIDAVLPLLFIEANIEVNGTISIFKFCGKGYYNETVHDIRGTWDLTGHVVNDTWNIEHFYTAPSMRKYIVYFGNLSEEVKEFNDIVVYVVKIVNEYWPILHRLMLPITATTVDPFLASIPKKFFSKVPFSEVFT
ncbi:PREDICTED: uncharacterized protein LOC105459994 [Wasmannia auropunctata]|uniref:uncharacterized protein LOC105459994 n=1 Tax=Wasmannia auropunctata TaxID=64793 RepID=UPI0005EFE9C6|nr:PREDICTED: uncharacterized protein LOC105459994 [Wasmannia auropunctata]